jgi:hypothetical protein
MVNKRIVIEATILPDDATWTPEKMPIILTKSKKGEIMEKELWIKDNWITSFYINESHVAIRGIKFLGYNYPVNKYYPISRFNKEKTDLLVEQCIFLADQQFSVIQVGVIGRGNEIKIDHCVFYNVNNAVIYWNDLGTGNDAGIRLTNCIIYGSSGCALWTETTKINLVFENNIISNCGVVFYCKEFVDTNIYSINNSIIVNNKHYMGIGVKVPSEFAINENNITKKGEISLRMIRNIFEPLPIDHLHIIPNTLGYNLGAGLFKHGKQ